MKRLVRFGNGGVVRRISPEDGSPDFFLVRCEWCHRKKGGSKHASMDEAVTAWREHRQDRRHDATKKRIITAANDPQQEVIRQAIDAAFGAGSYRPVEIPQSQRRRPRSTSTAT